jgi:hypothetical protein
MPQILSMVFGHLVAGGADRCAETTASFRDEWIRRNEEATATFDRLPMLESPPAAATAGS